MPHGNNVCDIIIRHVVSWDTQTNQQTKKQMQKILGQSEVCTRLLKVPVMQQFYGEAYKCQYRLRSKDSYSWCS